MELMPVRDILRRLRYLCDLPPAARPVSLNFVEKLAESSTPLERVACQETLTPAMQARFTRALRLIEKNAVVYHRGRPGNKGYFEIVAPNPKLVPIKRVTRKPGGGYRIVQSMYNPLSLMPPCEISIPGLGV